MGVGWLRWRKGGYGSREVNVFNLFSIFLLHFLAVSPLGRLWSLCYPSHPPSSLYPYMMHRSLWSALAPCKFHSAILFISALKMECRRERPAFIPLILKSIHLFSVSLIKISQQKVTCGRSGFFSVAILYR